MKCAIHETTEVMPSKLKTLLLSPTLFSPDLVCCKAPNKQYEYYKRTHPKKNKATTTFKFSFLFVSYQRNRQVKIFFDETTKKREK